MISVPGACRIWRPLLGSSFNKKQLASHKFVDLRWFIQRQYTFRKDRHGVLRSGSAHTHLGPPVSYVHPHVPQHLSVSFLVLPYPNFEKEISQKSVSSVVELKKR